MKQWLFPTPEQKLKRWLKRFIKTKRVRYDHLGMCGNIAEICGEQSKAIFIGLLPHKIYPIYDEHAGTTAKEQFETLPRYKGRQLKLRVELAIKVLEELHNEPAK